jgi:hypothetical protein
MSALPPRADIPGRDQHVCFFANNGHRVPYIKDQVVQACGAKPCAFLAIIVFEARAISGRRLRQGFSQSNSD